MQRIDDVFKMLQPVARDDRGPAAANRTVVGLDELVLVHDFKAFIPRQHRFSRRRAHVSEDPDRIVPPPDTRVARIFHALASTFRAHTADPGIDRQHRTASHDSQQRMPAASTLP